MADVPRDDAPAPMADGRPDRSVWINYRNHRGEVAWRHVLPLVWDYTASPWHAEPQWLMLDLDRGADKDGERVQRSFAMRDVLDWRAVPPEDKRSAAAPTPDAVALALAVLRADGRLPFHVEEREGNLYVYLGVPGTRRVIVHLEDVEHGPPDDTARATAALIAGAVNVLAGSTASPADGGGPTP